MIELTLSSFLNIYIKCTENIGLNFKEDIERLFILSNNACPVTPH